MIHINDSHVRLSDRARKIFEDKELSGKIVNAIFKNSKDLHNGKSITVENITIYSATNKKCQINL